MVYQSTPFSELIQEEWFKFAHGIFVQSGSCCGYLACFHALLDFKFGSDCIKEYKFKHFYQCLLKVKRILLSFVQSDVTDLDTVQISF